jgi:hypothetical protein
MRSIEIQRLEKISPPFEGGVAGNGDNLNFTVFISQPGWLIYTLELDGASHCKYRKMQEVENRDKFLKSFRFIVLRFENRFVFQEPEYL